MSSPGEVVVGKQFPDFELHELQQLLVVQHVHLVEVYDDPGHPDLTGEQDVLARLRLGAVRSGNQQYRAVHLGGAGDHVLDVVGVAGAVHVRVVARRGLILDVRGGDGDAPLPAPPERCRSNRNS